MGDPAGGKEDAPRTRFTCPRCGGMLNWDPGQSKFECQFTGDGFDADELVSAHQAAVDRAVQSALRLLDEHAAMLRALADARAERNDGGGASELWTTAERVSADAEVLRQSITKIRDPGGLS